MPETLQPVSMEMAFHGSVVATLVNTAGLYPHGSPDKMDVVIPTLQMGTLRREGLNNLPPAPRAEVQIGRPRCVVHRPFLSAASCSLLMV